MAQVNPHIAIIAQLTAEIADLERQRVSQVTGAAQSAARRDDWGLGTPEGQQSQRDFLAIMAEIQKIDNLLLGLRTQLAEEKKASDLFNQAVSEFVASGMSPEAATELALAQAGQKKLITSILKWLAVAAIVVAVVYGITLFIRWRKSRK